MARNLINEKCIHTFLRTDGRMYVCVCIHVRTYVRTDRQTDGHLGPALLGRLCQRLDPKYPLPEQVEKENQGSKKGNRVHL